MEARRYILDFSFHFLQDNARPQVHRLLMREILDDGSLLTLAPLSVEN